MQWAVLIHTNTAAYGEFVVHKMNQTCRFRRYSQTQKHKMVSHEFLTYHYIVFYLQLYYISVAFMVKRERHKLILQ